jgi:hypothetical protein
VPAAAIAKYGKGQSTDDLALAVELLFERNLLPRLNPMAALVSNDFRTERLYTEEVDLLLKQHQVSLQDAAGHEQTPMISLQHVVLHCHQGMLTCVVCTGLCCSHQHQQVQPDHNSVYNLNCVCRACSTLCIT